MRKREQPVELRKPDFSGGEYEADPTELLIENACGIGGPLKVSVREPLPSPAFPPAS
jgi:hypothetical protein